MHHLFAGAYNNQLNNCSIMLEKWDKDLIQFENLIETKKEAGENTAGLELNLAKGNERYNVTISTIEAAHRYIKSLQEELNEISRLQAENRELKKQIEHIERQTRLRICDML